MTETKEPCFYIAESLRHAYLTGENDKDEKHLEWKQYLEKGRYRDRESYFSLFEKAGGMQYRGESSHYLYCPASAQAIKRDCPSARIIVIVRNPADRLFSEYAYYKRDGRLGGNFKEFVYGNCQIDSVGKITSVGKKSKFSKGCFGELLEPWLHIFGSSKVMVITFEQLIQDPLATCRNIFDWLEVDPEFIPRAVHAERSGTPKSRGIFKLLSQNFMISSIGNVLPRLVRIRLRDLVYKHFLKRERFGRDLRIMLNEYYSKDIIRLQKMTGLDLSHWR